MKKKLKLKKEARVPHMVLVAGNGEPRQIHDSFESACAEAKRLITFNPSRLVSVLRLVTQFQAKVSATEITYKFPEPVEELPF